MKKHVLLFASIVCLYSCDSRIILRNQVVDTPFETNETRKIVDELYNHMSMEERTAQLYSIRSNKLVDANGNFSLDSCRKHIPNGIGHIAQFACALDKSPNELRDFVKELQHFLMTETLSKIPAIFHEEAITGIAAKGATVYPQQIGVACTWNPDLAALKTEQTAEAMRSVGSVMALSPMVDIIRTAHWNRLEESYGEDSYLSSRMALAFVEGLQRKNLEGGVAACSKHYLGYGGGSLSEDKELMEEIITPHEVMIRCGGSKAVMTGYHSFRGVRTVANDTLVNKMLRGRLGFNGIVVSDYSAVSYQWVNPSEENFMQRGVEAINNGNELEFSDGISYPFLPKAIAEGLVSEARFEEAVKRALTLKARAGLLNKKPKLYDEGELNLDKPTYRRTAYELACQSSVLLKNNGILPLQKNLKKIALVGPNANTFWCMLGDYTYQSMYSFWWGGKIDGMSPKIVSVKEAFQNKLSRGTSLSYERGCDWSTANEAALLRNGDCDPRTKRLGLMLLNTADSTDWNAAMEVSRESDVVVAALGENPTLCGEGRTRKGIRLPGDQELFVKNLIATGKPVVLVLFGGRPQVITDVLDGCAAVLQAWYPGEEGGDAVVDLLLGNINPSGKLCVSYPRTEDKGQVCYNYKNEQNEKVLFPFGYGLSYSTFEYTDLKIKPVAKTTDKEIEVSFNLKNTSDREGTEIVQLYISPSDNIPLKPIQLKGFNRVTLQRGEQRHVTFIVSPQQLAYYDSAMWNIIAGSYTFKIGASSEDIRLKANLELKGENQQLFNRSIFFSLNK